MRIYPAIHYTMGGLWVDYNLMNNFPGLHVIGEANLPPRRQPPGGSALMQGLADGYFVLPAHLGSLFCLHQGAKGDRPPRVQKGEDEPMPSSYAGEHQGQADRE